MADEAQQKIESYLTKLRGHLRGLSEETTREILKELRSHIMEKAAADGMTMAAVDATLAALGRPEELAQEYVTDELLARAEVSRSPLRILDGLVRWASLSVAGFLVLVASITGYFLGVVFILVAALKPFHPEAAGLWAVRDAAGDSSLYPHGFRLRARRWPRNAGLVDRAHRTAVRLPAADSDHAICGALLAAISQIASAA